MALYVGAADAQNGPKKRQSQPRPLDYVNRQFTLPPRIGCGFPMPEGSATAGQPHRARRLRLRCLGASSLRRSRVSGLVDHSDRGSQYVSIKYTERLADAGIEPSVGSVGGSLDNALAETVNGLYKAELIHRRRPWRSFEAVELLLSNGSISPTIAGGWDRSVTSRRPKPSNVYKAALQTTAPTLNRTEWQGSIRGTKGAAARGRRGLASQDRVQDTAEATGLIDPGRAARWQPNLD